MRQKSEGEKIMTEIFIFLIKITTFANAQLHFLETNQPEKKGTSGMGGQEYINCTITTSNTTSECTGTTSTTTVLLLLLLY